MSGCDRETNLSPCKKASGAEEVLELLARRP